MYSVVVESNEVEESEKANFSSTNESLSNSNKKILYSSSRGGKLHLFKEKNDERASRVDVPRERTTLLCILAFPSQFGLTGLINFFNPASYGALYVLYLANKSVDCAFIKFDSIKSACNFYLDFNGANFIDMSNTIMPAICHVIFTAPLSFIAHAEPIPIPLNRIQIPSCIRCLELIDTHVTGLLGIVCNHTFQCECATRWSHCKGSCVPCNYSNTPIQNVSCSECQIAQNIWICLICGYIGCSRYENKHSYEHFFKNQS
jgi:BRCA1-associated protein